MSRDQPATKEIVFVRHAESQANADGIWNGRMDGPLSEVGEASLEVLGRRLSGWDFDVVVSSPLRRAVQTAEAFAGDVRTVEDFIEIDVGRWEGMSFDEVYSKHGEAVQTALSTRTLPLGETGESLEAVARRALSVVDELAASLGEGQRAAVVTHGGILQAVLRRHLTGGGKRVHAFTQNASINRVVWHYGRPRLATFNDLGHFGPRPPTVETHLSAGNPVLALMRHGQTRANVEMRWQGHGDWDLDELGRRQAQALADWYGRSGTVYSSPLKRAASTASYIALNGVVAVEDFKELAMGKWEGLTTEEIARDWRGLLETIHRDGIDLRRGETGETWGELTARFTAAVEVLDMATSEPTVVVTHGGALRSYLTSLTRTGDTHSESLYTPANTSVTHVALTDRGPEILDYAVATHLEWLP